MLGDVFGIPFLFLESPWGGGGSICLGPVSFRKCVPILVAVRRSCRKNRGGWVQTDRQRDTAALYSRLLCMIMFLYCKDNNFTVNINITIGRTISVYTLMLDYIIRRHHQKYTNIV